MITATLVVAYGAVAGLIGLTIEEYKPKRASYLEKIMNTEEPKYNGISLRLF